MGLLEYSLSQTEVDASTGKRDVDGLMTASSGPSDRGLRASLS
jgi:hypothetical protein